MGGNYKVSSITIAVLTIVFASLQLTKSGYELRYEQQYRSLNEQQQQKEQQQQVESASRREGDKMIAINSNGKVADNNKENINENKENKVMDEFKKEQYAKWEGKYYRVGRIITIICNGISVITGLLIYSVVSDDVNKNQRKRHLLLPYIMWHMFITLMMIVACIYTAIVYRHYLSVLAHPLLVTACLVLLLLLCVTIVLKYFMSLSRASAFSYAQMDDVNEVKKPLA